MNNLIKINNLNYPNLFENLSLNIENNKFVVISGPNSCGKTTLIRILNREIITDSDITIMSRNINDYKIEDYSKIIQCIIPLEIEFQETTIKEELYYYTNLNNIEKIIKKLKVDKFYEKNICELSKKEIILSQLIIALASNSKIILIDDLGGYFSLDEIKEIFKILKKYLEENNMNIIYATVNLEEILNADYIYIINDKKIAISGETLEVLQKDNILNKIGLNLPFMVDLSVKLKDYELIDDIELNTARMVDLLWK